jgi:hypothetical protein
MSSSSSLAWVKALEPVGRDDHVAGGAGHLALAGAFQRHAHVLAQFQQALPCLAFGHDALAMVVRKVTLTMGTRLPALVPPR